MCSVLLCEGEVRFGMVRGRLGLPEMWCLVGFVMEGYEEVLEKCM